MPPPREAPRDEVAAWAVGERFMRELEAAAAAGAIVTLLLRFRVLLGEDGQPWRSTRTKQKRAQEGGSQAGSMQLFGGGARAERLLEQIDGFGGGPEGAVDALTYWAAERCGGEVSGLTSVEVFVLDGWPKGGE